MPLREDVYFFGKTNLPVIAKLKNEHFNKSKYIASNIMYKGLVSNEVLKRLKKKSIQRTLFIVWGFLFLWTVLLWWKYSYKAAEKSIIVNKYEQELQNEIKRLSQKEDIFLANINNPNLKVEQLNATTQENLMQTSKDISVLEEWKIDDIITTKTLWFTDSEIDEILKIDFPNIIWANDLTDAKNVQFIKKMFSKTNWYEELKNIDDEDDIAYGNFIFKHSLQYCFGNSKWKWIYEHQDLLKNQEIKIYINQDKWKKVSVSNQFDELIRLCKLTLKKDQNK